MKKWQTKRTTNYADIPALLLKNRGLKTKKEVQDFLKPPSPYTLSPLDVGIEKRQLAKALSRLKKALKDKESIVVYADYDADGITAGAIMWETLHWLGANVMPYIPHRVEEGYGLSIKGIDRVREEYDPSLIITVDHGVTAKEKVAYAKKLGIEVIVTDHHVMSKVVPDCTTVHTTQLSGAGVAWFLTKEVLGEVTGSRPVKTLSAFDRELLALAAIGSIADMVPLVGANRSIVKYGLEALNQTKRVGLEALMTNAGLAKGGLGTYDVSHMLAPRLNAMGRLEHALDALRLLCTKKEERAILLAQKLGLTNRERQQLTEETVLHARELYQGQTLKEKGLTLSKSKLIFIAHESYNQGVIGLVAGKLVEEFYLPAVVVAKGEEYSKASARSINGFDVIEAIRSCSDMLVDVGGHPMAAGFTVETRHLDELRKRLEKIADNELDEEKLTRVLKIDLELPLAAVTEELWKAIQDFAPFGFGNPEPVFATRNVQIVESRLVGTDGKHLKLKVTNNPTIPPLTVRGGQEVLAIDAIAFNQGNLYRKLRSDVLVDIAYTIDMDTWNGKKKLQLKIKDIHSLKLNFKD